MPKELVDVSVGHNHRDRPARATDPNQFGDDRLRVVEMLDDVRTENKIKRAIIVWQCSIDHKPPEVTIGQKSLCSFDGLRRKIQSRDVDAWFPCANLC